MAVFTALDRGDIAQLLASYALGDLVSYQGIGTGIENTNYFVTTTAGDYVLTIFERLGFRQLPFYLDLMRHLARRDLPVPAPQENAHGSLISEFKSKPAAFVTRMPGRVVESPTPAHCERVGTFLARMHLAGQDYPRFQPHLRGIGWWKTVLPELEPYVSDTTFHQLAEEVIYQDSFFRSPAFEKLPRGPIHADLFRDNVLFVDRAGEPAIGGVVDFYFAGCSIWLFDVAVAVNDWCVDLDDGALVMERATALLRAYHEVRPFTDLEQQHWRTVLRAAALRFWISRLHDLHVPRTAYLLKPHDPGRFERTLRRRIADPELPWVQSMESKC
ncbi:MAG: homoserine kinase [Gemmatimonadota bacterium]